MDVGKKKKTEEKAVVAESDSDDESSIEEEDKDVILISETESSDSDGNPKPRKPSRFDADGRLRKSELCSDHDSDEFEEEMVNKAPEMIIKDFSAETPVDDDLEGITALCKQMWKFTKVDPVEFAKILIEQNYVTTVLKEALDDDKMETEEDEELLKTIYGVYSAVNLKTKKDNPAVKQIRQFLKDNRDAQPEVMDDVEEMLSDAATEDVVGLLVKEKIVNIPAVAAVPFLFQLKSDILDAAEKKMPYNFTHYLYFATLLWNERCYEFLDDFDEMLDEFAEREVTFKSENKDENRDVIYRDHEGRRRLGKFQRRLLILSAESVELFFKKLRKTAAFKPVLDQAKASGLKLD